MAVQGRLPGFLAFGFTVKFEQEGLQVGSVYIPMIFASVHSQTASSDSVRFAHVFLTDIGTPRLLDD